MVILKINKISEKFLWNSAKTWQIVLEDEVKTKEIKDH